MNSEASQRSGFDIKLGVAILAMMILSALTLPYAAYDYTNQQVVRWAIETGRVPGNAVHPCCNPLTVVFALSVFSMFALVLFGLLRGRELRQKEKVQ